jgi:uncharacterized protein (DUF1800 family)
MTLRLMNDLRFIALLGMASLATDAFAVDTNGDGMCDVWEARYHAGALLPGDDTDADDFSNLTEATAGTDPFDAMSHPRASVGTLLPGNAQIIVPSEPGKSYRLLTSDRLDGEWIPSGTARTGDGSDLIFIGPRAEDHLFYRIAVSDGDADADGVSDWAERQLAGFDAENGDSFSSGTAKNDLAAATALMQALLNGEVSAGVTQRDAYEKGALPATLSLTRSGATTYPMTVFLKTRGAVDPTKSSASAPDFSLANVAVIPAGSASAAVAVAPLEDALNEVPEELRIDISFVAEGLLTRVCDAPNIPANERFFYAAFTTEESTPASGYSLIRLQGDNDIGLVSSVFAGLTSAQSAAEIHVRNPVTGPSIKSLGRGQLTDFTWAIRAAQILTTDQAVLNALFAGRIYSDVQTENHPSGEIRADYLLTTASTEFTPPSAPPAIGAIAGTELDRDIARFLTQSTFGSTPALIAELRELVNSPAHNGDRISAFSAWLDAKFSAPQASLEALARAEDAQLLDIYKGDPSAPWYDANYFLPSSSRRHAWWSVALFSDDQVRQRVATALMEILVTSSVDDIVDQRNHGHSHYYDMLAAGIAGSYRDLLWGVSTHPIMGQYLSSLRNQKAITDSSGTVLVSPDENYAREIMQLFSIGLVQLHPDGSLRLSANGQPIPTYGQADIVDLARVFTGWSFSKRNSPASSSNVIDNTTFSYGNGGTYQQAQWLNPMKQFPAYHDTGAKSVLGLAIPQGRTGEQELADILNHLAAHPNIAPFISKKLIQRLVTSNPSAGYVHRVSTAWIAGGGNLRAVAKAILLDYEARSPDAASLIGAGKKKEPLLHYTGLARALQAGTELKISDLAPYGSGTMFSGFPAGAGRFREGSTDSSLGQTPLHAPTVFNWFYPDYSTGGAIADAGLVTPEFQIATEINTISHINTNYTLTTSSSGEAASSLPNYSVTGYGANADHLIPDVTLGVTATQAREKAYMAVMDQNGDGIISAAGDPLTFNKPAKIREACVALVDHLDLLLCAGTLKGDYGASADLNNPRDIIINTLAAISTTLDDNDVTADQERVRHERYEQAAYLISVSPQSIIQR